MSVDDIPERIIDKLTLPIRYGRYENRIAKSFAKIQSLKGSKFEYIYKCKGEGFTHRMKQIGSTFQEVKMDLAEEKDDIQNYGKTNDERSAKNKSHPPKIEIHKLSPSHIRTK